MKLLFFLLILAAVAAPMFGSPIGSYNFFLPAGTTFIQPTKIKITAKAKDGTTFEETFTFGGGTQPDSARDTVKQSLTSSGWDVSNAGAQGINITGHGGSAITEVNGGIMVPGDRGVGNLNVSEDASSGVKTGEATVGENYKFAFLPLDGSGVLVTGGTVTAVFDGVPVSAGVHSGESPTQVASDLFAALVLASVPATLSGNEISFILNPMGTEVLHTDLTLNAQGLEALIGIPARTVIPEPSTLLLVSVSLVGLLRYGARKARNGVMFARCMSSM